MLRKDCIENAGRIKRAGIAETVIIKLNIREFFSFKMGIAGGNCLWASAQTAQSAAGRPLMCASTRGHKYKLFKKPHVSRIRANFFSERVVNSWNSLLDSVDFSSLPRFKRSINKVDFSQFLKCF